MDHVETMRHHRMRKMLTIENRVKLHTNHFVKSTKIALTNLKGISVVAWQNRKVTKLANLRIIVDIVRIYS